MKSKVLSFAALSSVFGLISNALSVALGAGWWNAVAIAVIQWIAGKVQKSLPNQVWDTRVVPVMNYILAALGFTLAPIPAHAASLPEGLNQVLAIVSNPLVAAALCTVFTGGVHSTGKNLAELFKNKRSSLARAALEAAMRELAGPPAPQRRKAA